MQESESKTKRERLSSSRNLNAHIADGPLSSLDLEGAASKILCTASCCSLQRMTCGVLCHHAPGDVIIIGFDDACRMETFAQIWCLWHAEKAELLDHARLVGRTRGGKLVLSLETCVLSNKTGIVELLWGLLEMACVIEADDHDIFIELQGACLTLLPQCCAARASASDTAALSKTMAVKVGLCMHHLPTGCSAVDSVITGALGPDTPPLRESKSLTYFTDETLQEKVERHLHDIVEADLIQRLQASSSMSIRLCAHRRAILVSCIWTGPDLPSYPPQTCCRFYFL